MKSCDDEMHKAEKKNYSTSVRDARQQGVNEIHQQ